MRLHPPAERVESTAAGAGDIDVVLVRSMGDTVQALTDGSVVRTPAVPAESDTRVVGRVSPGVRSPLAGLG